MTRIQKQAFDMAVKTLDKKARFYNEDIAELRRWYSKRKDPDCLESIARLSTEVTQQEIRSNCQL